MTPAERKKADEILRRFDADFRKRFGERAFALVERHRARREQNRAPRMMQSTPEPTYQPPAARWSGLGAIRTPFVANFEEEISYADRYIN